MSPVRRRLLDPEAADDLHDNQNNMSAHQQQTWEWSPRRHTKCDSRDYLGKADAQFGSPTKKRGTSLKFLYNK